MTRHNLTINGQPIHARLTPHRVIARDLVTRFTAEIPLYAALPREELDGDITRITAANLRIVARMLRTGEVPGVDELGELAESAAVRAAEGVPLGAVLAAYSMGLRVMWHAVLADARPDDLADALAATDLVLRYQEVAVSVVATAYAEERQTIVGHEREARRELLSALLEGRPTAARVGPSHVVVVFAFATHPDEATPGTGAQIAARRRVRRVQAELDPVGPNSVDARGGVAVLPPEADVAGLVRRLQAVVDVRAAWERAATAELPAAHQRAREVLDVVLRLGRPPGLYRLADVLLEYQLGRLTPATAGLAALLDPLDDNPDLLPTLELYLAEGLNRRRTAALLHVHPNTVDYRLRRIVALTGLDPGNPGDLQHIGAALAARRVRAGAPEERETGGTRVKADPAGR
ncbi:PucR family transcriptional regulator [Saccharothrix variisporea]|uniref:PucR-like helix-turn-helix protein n=1 Tax=Saccharothrix variisporea TaxID=543527 RepID=A0A495X7M3_9PSEU|nr:PucR family transcriptional regulator [Saccharothrix variisporea]RKT69937.1 PucR-like helix-turn-helix protein [Saccharothrix variisporea]